MNEEQPLVNRVANSGLITINLEKFFPQTPVRAFDLKDYLFMELILKEKDFREALKNHDWQQYQGKILCVFCSSDAIIPTWAYMLVASYAAPVAEQVVQATPDQFYVLAYQAILGSLDYAEYQDQRIVIKGCGDKPVPVSAYVELTRRLRPIAKSILFGEPCSTVPIYKKPKS